MGYGELVPKGRYPVAVVFVSVPEGSLDVNVHPQKLEVRFSEPQIVYAAVRHTVRRGVGAAPWLADGPPEGVSPVRMRALAARVPPEGREASALAAGYARDTARMLLPFGPAGAGESATWTPPAGSERWGRDLAAAPLPVAEPGAAYDPGGPRGGGDAAGDDASAGDPAAAGDLSELRPPAPTDDDAVFDARGDAGAPGPGAGGDAYGSRSAGSAEPGAADAGRAGDGSAARTPAAGSADAATFFSRLRYIGQLDRTYLLCEADGELILIDQHAAHERVAFQRLRERYQQRELPVQRVLFPEQIELGADQAAVAEDSRDTLSALGFEVEPFGGDTWVIKTVPAGLRAGDAASEVLRALLGELAERGGSRAVEERLDLALATIACHSVVRAGDALSPREVVALLSSMDGVDFKAHCPHGRPVLLRISVGEIARRFGRT
jgi:DNA mismatch repair protein MutL